MTSPLTEEECAAICDALTERAEEYEGMAAMLRRKDFSFGGVEPTKESRDHFMRRDLREADEYDAKGRYCRYVLGRVRDIVGASGQSTKKSGDEHECG